MLQTLAGHINWFFSAMQWSGRILGIIGWDPSICKSNRSHVDILRFSFIKLGYILQIPLKWLVIFLQSWTSTGYISNSTGSSVTNCRFSPIIGAAGFNIEQIKVLPAGICGKTIITCCSFYSSAGSSHILWRLCLWGRCRHFIKAGLGKDCEYQFQLIIDQII